MGERKISARGVYYDLSLSPYEYESPYGDLFKFSSQKKLEIYARDIVKEVSRVEKMLDRNGLKNHLPPEIVGMLFRMVYRAFYRETEV